MFVVQGYDFVLSTRDETGHPKSEYKQMHCMPGPLVPDKNVTILKKDIGCWRVSNTELNILRYPSASGK